MADENDRSTSRRDAEAAPGQGSSGGHGPDDAGAADADRANPPGDGAPDDLAARLGEAEQKLESYRDQALRAQAEAENARRRASRDVENAHKFALEKFTADLLPVLDSLEKAVEAAAASDGAASIGEGVELSLKLFLNVLEKHGIERLDPAGEPFDPQFHEAMTVVPSEHAEPNSVLEVMQRGYVLNGRLVRAAKVVVARAPDPGASGRGVSS